MFDRLGIIGVCNSYHLKFKGASDEIRERLERIQSDDADIMQERERALNMTKEKVENPKFTYTWSGNDDFKRQKAFETYNKLYEDWTGNSLEKEKVFEEWKRYMMRTDTSAFITIPYIAIDSKDSLEALQDAFQDYTSRIQYDQIGEAMMFMENYNAKYNDSPWRFIEDDFGIPVENISDQAVRKEFMTLYYSKNEYELYDYYLSKITTKYKNKDGTFNYDYIYEILKYDFVTAFVGGGGGRREKECYPIIKLLEIKFETTLGFPKRLCNSFGSYGCSADDRAMAWIDFLVDKKLITNYGQDAPSFAGVR